MPSLTEDKVAKFEEMKEGQPEFEALKDPDITTLAAGSVLNLATNAFGKGLLAEDDYQYIIRGGNETEVFIRELLHQIAKRIKRNPNDLETFITKVLNKIGSPVSDLGKRLRKSFSLNS